jgi:excisionase family DNA binding protein
MDTARADFSAPGRLALSMPEAAIAIGVSRAYLYGLLAAGDLRTFKLGRRRMVSVESLRKLIATRERAERGAA